MSTGTDEKSIRKSPMVRMDAQLDLLSNLRQEKDRFSRYWTMLTTPGEHIWTQTSGTHDCYIGDIDCSKLGDKLKCSACRIVIHEGCLSLLGKLAISCKITYTEANPVKSSKPISVQHHWIHKWRQDGRCKHCGRSFQSKFLNRELVAICCSWCKKAYHNRHGCFTMAQIEEPCSLGPLKEIMIPSTWIIRLPTFKESEPFENKIKQKKSKKWLKNKLFTIRIPNSYRPDSSPSFPLIIFVNPKSGGNKGSKILHNLYWLLNPRQVFDLSALRGPKYGLEMFNRIVSKIKILACGGDGSVGWILSTLDALKWPVYPPIAILPLGTGNDLAQTLGWGSAYDDESLTDILLAVAEESSIVYMDRWRIETKQNGIVDLNQNDENGVSRLPLDVMNNYFSIGADAQAALQFHESRTANPDVFNSRMKNRIYYAGVGTQDLFRRTWRDLHEYVTLECDGIDLSAKLQELKVHCLVFLNIPRYAGGTQPWGFISSMPQGDTSFMPSSFSDGRLEVLGFTAATLAALQVGGRGERIAQCSTVRLTTNKAIPAQVDGEPCKLASSVITINFHSRVPMLQRTFKNPYVSTESSSATKIEVSTVILKLIVMAVTENCYNVCKNNFNVLAESAIPCGLVTAESDTDLQSARLCVQKSIESEISKVNAHHAAVDSGWFFLDCSHRNQIRKIDISEDLYSIDNVLPDSKDRLFILHADLITMIRGQVPKIMPAQSTVRLILTSNEEPTVV